MLKKTIQILESSRIFSLPMTLFSWLVIFTFGTITSGNIIYGLLTLIGLGFVHLATNMIDDYFDYKFLIKMADFDKTEYLKNSQKTKCRYLINGILKERDMFFIIGTYLFAALLIGLFLFIKCGIGIMYFALAGAIIAITYPFVSRFCLSEAAVALAYGPALFGGVYYAMSGTYSNNIYILCIPTMIMTVILLYIHTVMDFEFDLNEGKKTIANRFNSELDALIILKILLVAAYVSVILLCIFDIADWQVFLTYLTIPLAIDLYNSMVIYSGNPEEISPKKWYHFPMENYEKLETNGDLAFMMRMYQSRNLMVYFSLLLALGLILALEV